MNRHSRWLITCCLVFSGCGDRVDDAKTALPASSDVEVTSLKVIPASQLPALAELPGPLDGGRVSLAGPPRWYWASRSDRYLALFLADRGSEIPRIVVKARAAAVSGLDQINADNVRDYAVRFARHLRQQGVDTQEPVKPMVIGQVAAVRYVLGARLDNVSVQRQMLVTQCDGRQYEVDLTVYHGKIEAYRDTAYAVLASFRFH